MQNGATGDPTHLVAHSKLSNLSPTLTTAEATTTTQTTTSTWDRWRYPGGKRDLRLDAIRGIAVLVMLIDHLGGEHSWLYILSGHDRFFISAAEPFIFVSGLVMGLVYSRIVAAQGLRAAAQKALKRAATLYLLTVGVGLTFALLSLQLDLPWAPHWAAGGMGDYFLSIITFHRAYYLTDVLLLYTLLVLAAVPLIALLARGYSWLVLAISWTLWIAWQIWPQHLDLPWQITDNDIFHFSAWQVLFFTALVIGYSRPSLSPQRFAGRFRPVRRLPRISRQVILSITVSLTATLVVATIAAYLWIQQTPSTTDNLAAARFFEKANLRLGRLIVFAPFILFAVTLLTILWTPIKRLFGWLLLPLGQHALAAFTFHLFIIALLTKSLPAITSSLGATWDSNSAAFGTIVQLIGIALLWLAVQALIRLQRAWPRLLARATQSLDKHNSPQESDQPTSRKLLGLPSGGIITIALLLALIIGATFVLLIHSDSVARRLQALDDKGKNTIVMMTTSTARVPLFAPNTPVPTEVKANAFPSPTSKAISTAPAATSNPAPPQASVLAPDTSTPTTLSDPALTPEPVPSQANPPTQVTPTTPTLPHTTPTPKPLPSRPTVAAARVTPTTPAKAKATPPVLPSTSLTSSVTSTPTIYMTTGVEAHTFSSAALGLVMPYLIYLPPRYYTDNTKLYPVLYMLHGIGGWHGEWAQLGLLGRANDVIVAKQIDPFIIVLPQGDQGYWIDQANNGPKWGTYLAQDVVNEIDSHFRTLPDRDHRGVGGLSMGAHAALQIAINYPDTFGIAGAHSLTLHTYENAPTFFGDQSYFKAHDPVSLYAARPEIARTLKLWIDAGDQDPWFPIITDFHDQLLSDGIPHEWHVYTGAHTIEYWATHILDYLSFYDNAFRNAP